MKKFFNEFKDFAMKGNVMNLAVGIIIGAAFQSVVTSLTENVLSPILGLFTQRNFDSLSATFLGVTLSYGAFITSIINFIIMAFVVFLLVRAMSKLVSIGKKPVQAEASTKICRFCQSTIHINAVRCPACTSQLE